MTPTPDMEAIAAQIAKEARETMQEKRAHECETGVA